MRWFLLLSVFVFVAYPAVDGTIPDGTVITSESELCNRVVEVSAPLMIRMSIGRASFCRFNLTGVLADDNAGVLFDTRTTSTNGNGITVQWQSSERIPDTPRELLFRNATVLLSPGFQGSIVALPILFKCPQQMPMQLTATEHSQTTFIPLVLSGCYTNIIIRSESISSRVNFTIEAWPTRSSSYNNYVTDGISQYKWRQQGSSSNPQDFYETPKDSYFFSQTPFTQVALLNSLCSSEQHVPTPYFNYIPCRGLAVDKLFWDDTFPKMTGFSYASTSWPQQEVGWVFPLSKLLFWGEGNMIQTFVSGLPTWPRHPYSHMPEPRIIARLQVYNAGSGNFDTRAEFMDGQLVITVDEPADLFRQPGSITAGTWQFAVVTFKPPSFQDLRVRWVSGLGPDSSVYSV